MDPQCKTAVVTLMDSGKDHPLATWLQIEKVLTAHGMAYKAKVSPEAMLVHPGNRASLCLNPFEVHAKGGLASWVLPLQLHCTLLMMVHSHP